MPDALSLFSLRIGKPPGLTRGGVAKSTNHSFDCCDSMTNYCQTALRKFVLLASVLCFGACGHYSFSGSLPSHLRTVAIEPFDDRTSEFGVREMLTEALEQKFTEDNTLKMSNLDAADAVISGAILRISDRPDAVTREEAVSNYRVFVAVRVAFTDRRSEEVIWDNDGRDLSQWGIYDFSQGDPELRNQALQEATDKLAEDILNKVIGGW